MKVYSYSKHISWQKIPQQKKAFAYNIITRKYYCFENVGYHIWVSFERESRKISEITSDIMKLYSANEEEVCHDIQEFLEDLIQAGLITADEKY